MCIRGNKSLKEKPSWKETRHREKPARYMFKEEYGLEE